MSVQSDPHSGAGSIDLGREKDFALGPLIIHPSTCEVEADGRRETVQPRAMQVLVALHRAKSAVVSRDQLIETCWEGRIIGEDAINRAIAKVRALADLSKPPAFHVETVPRVGFRLTSSENAEPLAVIPHSELAPMPSGEKAAAGPFSYRSIITILAGSILAVVAAALLFVWSRNWVHPTVPSKPADASIAVLPFLNMSGDPGKEYFSDGFSEELLNDLSNTPQLRVAARTSSFAFKGKAADIREIANRLHVRTVLEGSVRESGDRVRITAQLIDAESGYHRWSHTYDRQLTDILLVQDDIARAITAALVDKLLLDRQPPLNLGKGAISPDAYRKFLLGKSYFEHATAADNDRAIPLFKDVTILQPDFSDGFAMLGYAYLRRSGWRASNSTTDDALVRAALDKALTLNARNISALIAYMDIALKEQNWSAASNFIARMQGINPHNVTVARAMGLYYMALGFPEQAASAFKLATTLDPLSFISWSSLAGQDSILGRNDEAIAAGETALALSPDNAGTLAGICLARVARGEIREAQQLAAELEQTPEGRQLKGCAMEIARTTGDSVMARHIIDERVKNNEGSPAFMGQNYLEIGDYGKALPLLERAYDEGDTSLYMLIADPVTPRDFLARPEWKALTQRPRFRAWQAAHDRLAAELAMKK